MQHLCIFEGAVYGAIEVRYGPSSACSGVRQREFKGLRPVTYKCNLLTLLLTFGFDMLNFYCRINGKTEKYSLMIQSNTQGQLTAVSWNFAQFYGNRFIAT